MPIVNVMKEKEMQNAYIGEYIPAWIYHNATLGLISLSSDGSNWITIADKNLWANTVWNSWDTLSEDNCGNYYQWWNNYWFSWITDPSTSGSNVDASNYWPWNYYSNYIFRTGSYGWDSSDNRDLWWWNTWTNEAMRWPCDSSFHIPSKDEVVAVYNIWTALWGWSSDSVNFWIALKLPFAWLRGNSNWWYGEKYSKWYYWCANKQNSNNAYSLFIQSSWIWAGTTWITKYGCSIRPFANTSVVPDSSRTKLY